MQAQPIGRNSDMLVDSGQGLCHTALVSRVVVAPPTVQANTIRDDVLRLYLRLVVDSGVT